MVSNSYASQTYFNVILLSRVVPLAYYTTTDFLQVNTFLSVVWAVNMSSVHNGNRFYLLILGIVSSFTFFYKPLQYKFLLYRQRNCFFY